MSHLSQRQMRRLAALRVLADMGVMGGPNDRPREYTGRRVRITKDGTIWRLSSAHENSSSQSPQ